MKEYIEEIADIEYFVNDRYWILKFIVEGILEMSKKISFIGGYTDNIENMMIDFIVVI